jgi:exopolysaccharide production protein ExoZ
MNFVTARGPEVERQGDVWKLAQVKPLDSIQYLRAAAALGVVGFHACQWRAGGFNVGRAGVDVFFVISGVIMWRVTAAREARPGQFLWRRITRVAPLYWVITLALAGVAALWPAFLPNVHPGARHLLLSFAFIPHLDPTGLPFPLLPPGWTLNYEAVFYLVFAAALFAPRRRQAWIVCAALFLIVAAGLILNDPVYILGANPLLWEFAAGLAVANLADISALPGRRGGWILIVAGLTCLAVPAVLGWFSELGRPFIWGVPAAAIVAGAIALEHHGAIPSWPAIGRLGDASYALYLIHLPAQALVAHTLGAGNSWVFIPAALAASIVAGLACHAWIETPLIRLARSLGTSKPVVVQPSPVET